MSLAGNSWISGEFCDFELAYNPQNFGSPVPKKGDASGVNLKGLRDNTARVNTSEVNAEVVLLGSFGKIGVLSCLSLKSCGHRTCSYRRGKVFTLGVRCAAWRPQLMLLRSDRSDACPNLLL